MRQIVQSPALRWLAGFLVIPGLVVGEIASSLHTKAHAPADSPEPIDLGMVALLASPEKYNGKRIRTIGYLCLEFEGNALYFHEEDYRYRVIKNAVDLNLSMAQEKQFKNLSLKHVLIEGTVSASIGESEGSGAIGDVTRLEYWRARGDTPAPPQVPPPSSGR